MSCGLSGLLLGDTGMTLTTVDLVDAALPRQRTGSEDADAVVRPRTGAGPVVRWLDVRWLVDAWAAACAALGTGLVLRSFLLGLVLCVCWAGLPRAAERRPSGAAGASGAAPRAVVAVGVLVLVDEVVGTGADQADMVAAALLTLLVSMVFQPVVRHLGRRGAEVAPYRRLVVHGDDLAGVRGLGIADAARLHRLDGDGDPVPGILREVARSVTEEVVVLPDSGLSVLQLRRLGWELERTGALLRVVTPLTFLSDHRVRVRGLGNALTLDVRPRRLDGSPAFLKACVERLVALLTLVAVGPLLLLLMVAIRLESPGSPIFTQVRTGKDGRPFRMFKLRSMYAGAELARKELEAQNQHHGDGVLFKIPRDPRVTRWGRLIRRSSLDELPQLVNVVRGDMSLIGPRPALPDEVAQYDETATRRLAVLPGLTGLWQVSGRSDLSWEDSVELDLHYVDNWQPGLDLAIVARTVRAVASARGAY